MTTPSDLTKHTRFVFRGAHFWSAFEAQRAAYPGDETTLRVIETGGKCYLQLCDTDDTGDTGGDPINDSHQCPGSPGCPH